MYSTFEARNASGEILCGLLTLDEAEKYASENKEAAEIVEVRWKSLGNGNCEYVDEQHVKYVNLYYVHGINCMGNVWYVSTKGAHSATLWSGAPKEMRATYTKEEARAEIARLNDIFKWGSTRHYMEIAH